MSEYFPYTKSAFRTLTLPHEPFCFQKHKEYCQQTIRSFKNEIAFEYLNVLGCRLNLDTHSSNYVCSKYPTYFRAAALVRSGDSGSRTHNLRSKNPLRYQLRHVSRADAFDVQRHEKRICLANHFLHNEPTADLSKTSAVRPHGFEP